MKIYLDIDDVLCETARTLCGLAARVFGRHVRYEDVRAFDLQRVFGLDDGEMRRFADLSHARDCLMGYPATPGAVEGVRALRAAGAEIDLLTGRPAWAHAATEDWLASVGLGGLGVEYVDKYGRGGARRPGDPETVPLAALLARRYDFAVDDSPVVLGPLAAWERTRVLVFDRPWNRGFPLAPNMTRVAGWADILAVVAGG